MKKTEMREFQWLLTSDNACISDQFNDWIFKNNSDYPGFKITFMLVNAISILSKSTLSNS